MRCQVVLQKELKREWNKNEPTLSRVCLTVRSFSIWLQKWKCCFKQAMPFFVVVVFFEVYVKVTLCPGKFNHLYCAFMYLKYWIHAAYYSHNLRKLLQRLELLRHLMLNFFGGWALCRLKTNRRHTHKLQVELGGENIMFYYWVLWLFTTNLLPLWTIT